MNACVVCPALRTIELTAHRTWICPRGSLAPQREALFLLCLDVHPLARPAEHQGWSDAVILLRLDVHPLARPTPRQARSETLLSSTLDGFPIVLLRHRQGRHGNFPFVQTSFKKRNKCRKH